MSVYNENNKFKKKYYVKEKKVYMWSQDHVKVDKIDKVDRVEQAIGLSRVRS